MTTMREELVQRSAQLTRPNGSDHHRTSGIIATVFFSLAFLLIGFMIISWNGSVIPFQGSYLIPGILAVLVVVCIPIIVLIIRGSFSFFHPLVYAAWIYFFPAFVLGSLYLAFGNYVPWTMRLIQNPAYNLPLTLYYIALGFIGLTLGYAIPVDRRIGRAIARKLPAWNWEGPDLFIPSMALIFIGILFKLAAFASGNFGYQSIKDISSFGALLYMFGFLSEMGSFLLWTAIFRARHLILRHYITAVFLVALMIFSFLLGGGRGGLLSSVVLIICAYVYSGRHIKLRSTQLVALLVAGAVLVGMAYGTVFRIIKGNEAQMTLQDYLSLGSVTINQLGKQSLGENFKLSTDALFQRIVTVDQLAVYVSNYKYLKPLEASYGIADIWTQTWTAFIPRFLWPGKPVISGARGLGLLYFHYGGSSPAVSPMIDLLRNFGPYGILPGMALLGIFLRIIYTALIQGKKPPAWQAAGYYLLLTNLSFEAQYGTILPVLIRVCVVFFIGLALLYFFISLRERSH